MAQSTLVEALIADGRELIDDIVRDELPIAAAWWAKVVPEDELMGQRAEWKFFLVSPLVDQEGPAVAYRKIYDALRRSQRGDAILARISLSMIKVVGMSNPIAADVFKIIKRFRGGPPIPVGRCRLGNIEAEELNIIYVLTLPPPWQPVVIKTPVEVDDPLSLQESAAMSQIGAPGTNPVRAGWPKSTVPSGTIVNARVLGTEADPNPRVLVKLPDGRQGITQKSNTEPVKGAASAKQE